jgi:hypothetical protein
MRDDIRDLFAGRDRSASTPCEVEVIADLGMALGEVIVRLSPETTPVVSVRSRPNRSPITITSNHNCVSRSHTAIASIEMSIADHAHWKAFMLRDCRKGSNSASESIRALCLTSDFHRWKAGRPAARAMLLKVITTRSETMRSVTRSVHPHHGLRGRRGSAHALIALSRSPVGIA